jgi:NADPH2:quinone reductase
MKAVVIHEYGGPDVLSYEDVPDPHPEAGGIVVRVESVSVNQSLDVKLRAGGRSSVVRLPHIPGVDPAGVVVELGTGVQGIAIGDRVALGTPVYCGMCDACKQGVAEDCDRVEHYGVHRPGGYAQYVAARAEDAYRIPDELDFQEAAVALRHGPTAFNMLRAKAAVQPGETVLVTGASGGLGSAGVQIAKLLGATVIAGAGAPSRVDAALAMGADHAVNYRETELAAAVLELTGGRGVDVVFDTMGDPDLWPQEISALAHRGRLVAAGAHVGAHVPLDVRRLYGHKLRLIGGGGCNRDDIAGAFAAAVDGDLSILIDRTLPLSQAAAAHRLVESGQRTGKIMLDPWERA